MMGYFEQDWTIDDSDIISNNFIYSYFKHINKWSFLLIYLGFGLFWLLLTHLLQVVIHDLYNPTL